MAYQEKIRSLRFNQDHGCFICCLDSSVRIYNIEPLAEKAHYSSDDIGSMSKGDMLGRTNLMALVGGGPSAKHAENAVLIYDDFRKEFVLEFTFDAAVLNVRLTNDRLIVVLLRQIHVFSFPHSPQRLFVCTTGDNISGLCEVAPSCSPDRHLIAFPGQSRGHVQIMDLFTSEPNVSQAPMMIKAHESSLTILSFNHDGTMLATASQKGTLIRVWDTYRKIRIKELRRGTDTATLYCINFSSDGDFLCCSSDKGTVHIFALKETQLNRRSTFSGMSFLGNYVESEWALANFTVPPECACLCAFGPNSAVYAICFDGTFAKYVFNKDGYCNRESFDRFLESFSDDM